MIKTITITAHNRPDLLKRLLESLTRNNLEGWKVFLSVEPTDERENIVSIADELLSNVQHEIILPKEKQGVKTHPFKLLSYVYDEIGSDVNIYLEEDLEISPDVIKIADWYMTLPRSAYKTYGGVCLCNFWSFDQEFTKEDAQEFFVDAYSWSALGFITDRRGWQDQLKFNWYRSNHHLQRKGWDFAIRAHIIWHGIKWLYPKVSRSNHTGVHGTHCNPKVQKQYKFDSLVCLEDDIDNPDYFISNFSPEELENICIVVPYRDRDYHIDTFVSEMSSHFEAYHPNINFEIHLIEQSHDKPFNRAKLLNIGYDINKHKDCYFCFHDIDLIPEGACCDYSYPHTPIHLSAFCSQFNYEIPYNNIFGGIALFDKLHFEKVNGYSNEYWGWGAEDDDMRKRLDKGLVLMGWERNSRGIKWHRRPGRFKSLPHPAGRRIASKQNKHKLGSGYSFDDDGLKTLKYTVIESIDKNGYTVHKVEL